MKILSRTHPLTLFGRSFKYPFFAGPVGAMTLHYGDKYNDLDYNNILVPACAAAGIAAFTGDGTNHKVMEGAAAAITACGGAGIPHRQAVGQRHGGPENSAGAQLRLLCHGHGHRRGGPAIFTAP